MWDYNFAVVVGVALCKKLSENLSRSYLFVTTSLSTYFLKSITSLLTSLLGIHVAMDLIMYA